MLLQLKFRKVLKLELGGGATTNHVVRTAPQLASLQIRQQHST